MTESSMILLIHCAMHVWPMITEYTMCRNFCPWTSCAWWEWLSLYILLWRRRRWIL